jgi:hypothetical protein
VWPLLNGVWGTELYKVIKRCMVYLELYELLKRRGSTNNWKRIIHYCFVFHSYKLSTTDCSPYCRTSEFYTFSITGSLIFIVFLFEVIWIVSPHMWYFQTPTISYFPAALTYLSARLCFMLFPPFLYTSSISVIFLIPFFTAQRIHWLCEGQDLTFVTVQHSADRDAQLYFLKVHIIKLPSISGVYCCIVNYKSLVLHSAK